ncbi:MAG: hypothetical protein NPINA01_18110 [Nitrospinaceae bacterium]|nr:MAG: hypothetical protein NPINA01_18110 [Nitrospinaceae bacterium]
MTDVPNNFTLPADLKGGAWGEKTDKAKLFRSIVANPPRMSNSLTSSSLCQELNKVKIFVAREMQYDQRYKSIITHLVKTNQELEADKYLENYESTLGTVFALGDPDSLQYSNIAFGFKVLPYEGESPFSILDESRDEDSKIRKYISFIRRSLNYPFGLKLADRISYLFDLSKEDAMEEEGEEEMSSESLKYFVYFIQSVPNLNYPDVVLTPDGNIVAEWRVDQNRHFNVEFMEDKYTHFVIFAPNQFDSQRPIRMSGVAPWEELIDLIHAQKVASWVLNNG